jgi:hypothetical protein
MRNDGTTGPSRRSGARIARDVARRLAPAAAAWCASSQGRRVAAFTAGHPQAPRPRPAEVGSRTRSVSDGAPIANKEPNRRRTRAPPAGRSALAHCSRRHLLHARHRADRQAPLSQRRSEAGPENRIKRSPNHGPHASRRFNEDGQIIATITASSGQSRLACHLGCNDHRSGSGRLARTWTPATRSPRSVRTLIRFRR